jgi:hypothetical protein
MGDASTRAIGTLVPTAMPPLRVMGVLPALSVTTVHPLDAPSAGGAAYVFDFGANVAGMVRLQLPAGHGIPAGTQLRVEIAEIVQGVFNDTGGLCALCPSCSAHCAPAGASDGNLEGNDDGSCDVVGVGATCNSYCANPARDGKGPADHALRDEPCWPHQSYKPSHPQ